MKLATVQVGGGYRLVAIVGDQAVDLHNAYQSMLMAQGDVRAAQLADAVLPADLIGLLEAGESGKRAARQALDFAATNGSLSADKLPIAYALADVDLCAPVRRPGKIICVGLNYRDHIREVGRETPEYPVLFAKFANTVIGPGEPIPKPVNSDALDYEMELAFVMGQRCRHVSEESALQFVAGYTIANDVSVRDYQRRTVQWLQGKAFDGTCPMGPWLVTSDELDPAALELSLSVNGEERQRSNTRHLVFTVPFLVSYLSAIMTLEPGDVVLTGTPGGVALGMNPPRWLKDGDLVRIEIEGIGVLEQRVVDERRPKV